MMAGKPALVPYEYRSVCDALVGELELEAEPSVELCRAPLRAGAGSGAEAGDESLWRLARAEGPGPPGQGNG